jgi:hypothetical protein
MSQQTGVMERIKARFRTVSVKRWIELAAWLIGLIVDVITLFSFIGLVNTPKESPLFYINSQEFLVWSLIAVTYALGYFNAKVADRWAGMTREIERIDLMPNLQVLLSNAYERKENLQLKLFGRRYALALLTSFPFDYLYIRAAIASFSGGKGSPWIAFVIAVPLSFIITFIVMFIGWLFYSAMSFDPTKFEQHDAEE